MPAVKPRSRASLRHAPREDAVTMLKNDHARVDELFKRFAALKSGGARKGALVAKICDELDVHMDIEEQIFYPGIRAAIGADALMDEAAVEHGSFKTLIEELRFLKPGDTQYDARVTVLAEYVRHHVKEEHEQMFPKARKTDIDLVALADAMRARKRDLVGPAARTQELFALSLAYPGMMV